MAFLQSLSLMFFCIKPDKWTKFSGTEENKNLVMNFFNTEDIMILVLYINNAGLLTASLGFPASVKTKGVYFVKKKMVRITPENIRDSLSVGDISNSPVEQLLTVLEEVVCTLFTNTDNMTTWPQVVSEDVVKHAQQLKNDVFVFGGQLKGKALLALPKIADDLEDSDEESDRYDSFDGATLHAIESVVIDWTHQVKDVLNKDSAQALLDGLNPLPREEIDFWDLRLKDLKCLHEQLWMPKARKISEVLEKSKSSYWPALKSLYYDIRAGLEEASDIVLYLIPLKSLIDELEQTEYSEVSRITLGKGQKCGNN
ncbi:dynein axonemal heavy chain 17-like [Rhincodon typus]|uniref:dynein axonemal heavy chain 17-like n=1 Tax=Rhincodon typus TaxID=259920 RepID=UPI002030127C|nr:dynein axonemal heavy chain 17-like [Rhincodon typus]